MAYENVKLRKSNFTAYDGYFYMFDEDQDNLLQKTDDGNTSFSYPFDTLLTNTIISTEYDGVYFWSMEDAGTDDITVRQWLIDNYVCKLQKTFAFTESGSHKYQSSAFSIEHYHTTLSTTAISGTSTLYLTDYSDHASMLFTTTSGDGVTLHIGPNSSGDEEDVEVSATISGGVTLASGIQNTYASSDYVNYYTNMWMFNNYDGVSSATGALYKIDAYTGDYLTKYAGGAYSSVTAATFYNVDSFSDVYGAIDTLCYVKGTNLLFVNTSQAGVELPYYGSMVMDNIEADEATLIDVYDITMDDQNIYRLQTKATYYGTTYTWTTKNYQLSTLDSFVTSISLAAYPAIIAANLSSTSLITALVKDQFWQPIIARAVTYAVDGSDGAQILPPNPDNTNTDGKATATLQSGNTAREVKVTAVVEQT